MTTTPKIQVTWASNIEARPVQWLWDRRIPLGTLVLLAGAEGIGKSSLTYKLIAEITTGTLEGTYMGQPKSVMIIASEDDWEFTIAPRLKAADADLSRVIKVEAENPNGTTDFLRFPDDAELLGEGARENDVALIVLDPIMSRIGTGLDTHKDSEVRQALEPLVRVASASGASVLGIIHINKRNSTDALNNLMGSRAFSAVSRAVMYVAEDPDDRETKFVTQAKSNLGPMGDLWDKGFQIRSKKVAEYTSEEYGTEDVFGSYLEWTEERPGAVQDFLHQKPEKVMGRPPVKGGNLIRRNKIKQFVHSKNEPLSKNQIHKGIGGNKKEVMAAINEMLEEGELALTDAQKICRAPDVGQ